jgi:hypothetical protein
VQFKLDTGAEVTAIREETYQALKGIRLKESTKMLYGPSHQPLNVVGQFCSTLSKGQASSEQTIFVVKGLKMNLLGLPAIIALQLISKVEATSSSQGIKERFKSVFQGLGTIGDEYKIKLKEGAVPHAIHTARNIPIPLRAKVQEELDRMEKLRVISKVEEPTPWCAGMVVVPKKSGNIRICVDLKPLNDAGSIAVMERLEAKGAALNPEKCEFGKRIVRFLGHIVDQVGIRPDPQKTAAILEMERPQNISELRRFMGMANQLGKFSPNLAEVSQPLRELLSIKKAWLWGPSQEQAFQLVKEELSCPSVLALYDPHAKSKISADRCFLIGAVLLQQQGEQWRPVA